MSVTSYLVDPDWLGVGELQDAALGTLPANSALLDSSHRKTTVTLGPVVDEHTAYVQMGRHFLSQFQVFGVHRSHQTILGVIGQSDGLF